MGKMKKNKKSNSDAIHFKKATSVTNKRENPFEIHFSKEKFSILGRKLKHGKGKPGVSRAKAVQKRKSTLGLEYKDMFKTNKFHDKRIGRGAAAAGMTSNDEIANARFATEKLTEFKTAKMNLFNLNDDEILTHRGQTLEEIEQFQDPASDEEDDEVLNAQFTDTVHFGGEHDRNDRKAAIEEMIAETKRKKAEAAKDKDEVYELTTKLDHNYKNLLPLMGKLNKRDPIKPERDEYDRLLKELIFEPRGGVTDKLQSEEEIAKREKERLEKLEQERLARMRGDEIIDTKPKHRSADDLDDGYFIDDQIEEATVAYQLDEESNKNGHKNGDTSSEEDEDYEENNHNEEENSDDEEVDGEGDNDSLEEDNGAKESSEDDLSDLKESDESESELENDTPDKRLIENNIPIINDDDEYEPPPNKRKCILIVQKQDLKVAAAKELPFTYDISETYQEFFELFTLQLPDYQSVILERMIKCNHPKLDPKNEKQIDKLFRFLLQYLNDIFGDASVNDIESAFMTVDRLIPHIYDLVQMNPEIRTKCILDVIQEKYNAYKKNPKRLPELDTIIFFKIISNIFSTSDFRHTIVTPCFIFIGKILSMARIQKRCDISIGLFLITIILEYTILSKRFMPQAMNFLLGILYLTIPKRSIEIIKVLPPFQSTALHNNLLVLKENSKLISEESMNSKDLLLKTIDDSFKIRVLNATLKLITNLIENSIDMIGICYLANPFLTIMEKIPLVNYPNFIIINYENAKNVLNTAINKPLMRLVAKERKPKALRLMEPKIEKVYDDKRRPKLTKDKEERVKMLAKVKRETKGAIREIRRDTAFLSKIQIQKQLQSDTERREKVQRIFAEASVQQGELNALARERNKK